MTLTLHLFEHPEGPPSEDDMELLVADLLFGNRIADAHELAAVMVSHWLGMPMKQRDVDDRARRFNYWLGIRSATAQILGGRRSRAECRLLKARA